MVRRCTILGVLLLLASLTFVVVTTTSADVAVAQETDEGVPPGNPVIGSDRPGDVEPDNDTNSLLWILLAVCLIGAGTLLVKLERWESRRRGDE